MAARAHNLATAVMGVNLAKAKITAFGLSSFFAGIEPLGLFGIWLRSKRYFIAWPFRY